MFKRISWSGVSRLFVFVFGPELTSRKIAKGYDVGAGGGIVVIVMGILIARLSTILQSALVDTYGGVLKLRVALPHEIGEQLDEAKALGSARMFFLIPRS